MFGWVLDRAPGVPHHSLHKTQQWKHGENKPSSPIHPAEHRLCGVCRRLGWNQQRFPFPFGAFHGTHWTDVVSRFKKSLYYSATSITWHIKNQGSHAIASCPSKQKQPMTLSAALQTLMRMRCVETELTYCVKLNVFVLHVGSCTILTKRRLQLFYGANMAVVSFPMCCEETQWYVSREFCLLAGKGNLGELSLHVCRCKNVTIMQMLHMQWLCVFTF